MTTVRGDEGPSREQRPSQDHGARRRRRAYEQANWMLTGAALTLTLAGTPADSPEVQAIGRALRLVNLAGGIEAPHKEVTRVYPPGGSRSPKRAG